MHMPSSWYEPSVYTNQFGMDEFQEEEFIKEKIEQFCKAALQTKNHIGKEQQEDLYMLVYEYIQDNIEKFIERPWYDRD